MTLAQKRQWLVNNNAKGQVGDTFGGVVAWGTKTRERPLPFEVALYCVEQVRYLPGLREKYLGRLDEAGLQAFRSRTEGRLMDAASEREGGGFSFPS